MYYVVFRVYVDLRLIFTLYYEHGRGWGTGGGTGRKNPIGFLRPIVPPPEKSKGSAFTYTVL